MNWNDYYIEQAGGGDYNTFKGALYQRGYGLGGMFGRFIKWIIPLIKKSAGPLLKGAASALGSEAVTTATNISSKARLFASLFSALFSAVFNAVESDWLSVSHAHSLDSDWLAAG